jgi:hypothetical protein
LVEAAEAAGVPVIAPVAVLKLNPDGREGEIAKAIGDVPPVAVTGVKDVAAVVAVRVSDAMTRVVERAEDIASENVLVAVADDASVTVVV